MSASPKTPPTGFEVRFEPLTKDGHALVFPCDARGRVDLDALPPRARSNYLYARALMGRDFSRPHLSPCPATALPKATRSAAGR
jgi:hypothetical protein